MKEKDVITILERLKNEPALGGGSDFGAVHARVLARNGFDLNCSETKYSWRDYSEFCFYEFFHTVARPLAVGMAIFVFAIVGGISITNASSRALPGDSLYPIKIGMEKAQLVLAHSANERASLHVEFTSRRLDEMVAVAALSHSSEPQTVQLAVERFKSEVETIQQELKADDGVSAQQTEFARTIGRKTEVYASTVTSTGVELSDDVRGEVEEIIEETKEQAVEVIITAHEQEQDEETTRELETALNKEIESTLAQYGDSAKVAIETATALQAEGNYRRAFQVLKEFELSQQE